MALSLKTLGPFLNKRAKKFEKEVNTDMRKIVIKTHHAFASGVPVDTGEARSNTRGPSARRTPGNVIPAYAPGHKLGIDETSNLNAATAQCGRAARVWKASSGKPFVVFNNWPEIERLNSGEISKQGQHFVERAERIAIREIRKVKWFR